MRTDAHILMVTTADAEQQVLSQRLSDEGYQVITVHSTNDSAAALRSQRYAVAIVNLHAMDRLGLTLIRDIRLREPTTQVIALAHRSQIGIASESMRAGAYDCAVLPLEEMELIAAVVTRAVEKSKLLSDNRLLNEQMHRQSEGRQLAEQKLERLATIDELTNLRNQRHYHEALAMELSRSQRYSRQFAVMLLEVDHFDLYCTHHGDKASELMLYSLARLLRDQVRVSDTVARYTDNQFALLLPETNPEGAYTLAERIVVAVDDYAFPGLEIMPDKHVTLSIGITTFPDHGTQSGALLDHAFQALAQSQESHEPVIYD